MKPGPAQSPIVRFLGESAGAGGPFALLGLPHEIASVGQITRAVDRRLKQVDCHRHRATPDADEVRLAIHTAAAQLRDPQLRAELSRRWPQGSPDAVPPAWRAAQKNKSPLTPQFMRRVRMLVGSSGGWSPAARKRLAHMARLNRISALEIVRALSPGQGPASNRRPSVSSDAPASRSQAPELVDAPASSRASWLGAYAVISILGLLLVTSIAVRPPNWARGPDESPAPPATASQSPMGESEGRPQRDRLEHYTAIAHELDRLSASIAIDASASIDRFGTIYPAFVDAWTEFPPRGLERSALHIAALVEEGLHHDQAARQLLTVLSCSGDNPVDRMIRSSILDVALTAPGLSDEQQAVLSEMRRQCVGADARPEPDIREAIVHAAAGLAADARTDDPDWWAPWLAGVVAATTEDPEQRARLVLSALTSRLRAAQPPDDGWSRTARLLVTSLNWREGSDERFWLLSQFADSGVSTARLSPLTEAMVTASGAPGIDARMVLDPRDNDAQRRQLADEYRQAWIPSGRSEPRQAREARAPELIEQLRMAIGLVPAGLKIDAAIDHALELANLNTAAWLELRGETTAAEQILASPLQISEPGADRAQARLDFSERDARLAEQVVNADSAAALRAFVDRIMGDDGPGVNTAHALVHLATDTDPDIRSIARAQLVRFRDRPPVLIAIDHAIGSSRIGARLEELVAAVLETELPPRTSEAWFSASHRALLARLAAALADEESARLAALEDSLADLYALQFDAGAGSDPGSAAVDRARALSQDFRVQLLAEESSISELDAIEAVTLVRLRRASSDIARVLAYQRELVALLASRLDRSVPGAEQAIEEFLRQLDERLDGSRSVVEQLAHTQRAQAQLLTLALERGGW